MSRERAMLFGPDQSLVGVVTRGDSGQTSAPPPLIMFNAGLLHRVGPHRLHVDVARRLAPIGVTSLRMDYSGIGDSAPRRDGLPASESVIGEGQDAMDALVRVARDERFVLMGLCSGADNAFKIARIDRRVVGLILIDFMPYQTMRFYLRYYGHRVFRPQSWMGFTKRHLSSLLGRSPGDNIEVPLRPTLPRGEVAAGFQALVDRGVSLLVAYTGGMTGSYNYRRQFLDTFHDVNFGDVLQLEHLEHSDHTLTLLEDRREMLELVETWMLKLSAKRP